VRATLARALFAALLGVHAASGEALTPGEQLNQATVGAAAHLLPPEILAHYTAGEYRSVIGRWPATPPWEPAFAAASERNAARLQVDARGTIVEPAGGNSAKNIYGLPFRVDAADPQAGVKAIWNAYYALWRVGSTHDVVALEWIGKGGRERQAILESHMLYYEGAPPTRRPADNPLDLTSQLRAVVTSPADLNGTASLAWRFRGADRRDQSWTYVPALRRVRQVSPANRSDGFLGSDLSQDDGSFFDGKPEDFTWHLVDEREALVLADPASLAGTAARRARPDGSIEESWPPGQNVVGYQDGTWRGVAWAPVAPMLVRRRLWMVEAVPRDPYYLFARIEVGLDQETFQGVTSRKFDGQGALLRSLQFLLYASRPIETGGEQLILPAASMSYIAAENPKAGRATVISDAPSGRSVHERRVPLDPDRFALEHLSAGK
jgi:uncharacterized protein DUF1329